MASLPSVKLKNALLKVGEEAAKGALDALSKGSGGMGDMLKTAFTVAPEKGKGSGGSKGEQPKGEKPKGTASEETTPKEEKKEVAKKVKKGKDAAESVMEYIGGRSVADISSNGFTLSPVGSGYIMSPYGSGWTSGWQNYD
jgi:hypothetical protein